MKVVDNSILVLLENGELYSWGDNSWGNLGHNRSFLDDVNVYVAVPTLVTEKVKDFALSDNVLVVKKNETEVYWCGLDKDFLL